MVALDTDVLVLLLVSTSAVSSRLLGASFAAMMTRQVVVRAGHWSVRTGVGAAAAVRGCEALVGRTVARPNLDLRAEVRVGSFKVAWWRFADGRAELFDRANVALAALGGATPLRTCDWGADEVEDAAMPKASAARETGHLEDGPLKSVMLPTDRQELSRFADFFGLGRL